MPKGFPSDHPADELLRATNWGVHMTLPEELALQPTFVKEIARRFEVTTRLVRVLNEGIGVSSSTTLPPRQKLF
jgi:hypothetical protein